jgi:pyruvate formate lyase activating enzyme
MLYERLPDQRVRCYLCAHGCVIADQQQGICQVRENQGGTLYTWVYGRVIARHVDPIEKKPLFHFYPGSRAYSIATPGCNFRCQWCQNAEISQAPRQQSLGPAPETPPQAIVAAAHQAGCRSIAYTYTEPTIFFEYAYDTALLASDAGLANVFVTNGYMTSEMLDLLGPYLDAANVDLKAFRDEVYHKYVGARLQPVLDSMIMMKKLGIWLEVTTLIIPGVNDDLIEIRDAARFVAQALGVETPWHISRFFPSYKMLDLQPTSLSLLRRAAEIGQEEGLRYVYVGNVAGDQDTLCHSCGHVLLNRSGYTILRDDLRNGRCPECGTPVSGRGMARGVEARAGQEG